MHYESVSLPNGLKIVHLPGSSPVSCCGFAVNGGTRDELPGQQGLAHFVEHMLFKGTRKRKSWHILNRMERVGGELNAYTTKEETFLYAISLSEDVERSMELLSDLIFNSCFPAGEIEKEREVVLDEINSYKDNPSELIFDEFENLLFEGNELGNNILGEPETLGRIDSEMCAAFTGRFYRPRNMIFFSRGKTPFSRIVRLATRYFQTDSSSSPEGVTKRICPVDLIPRQVEVKKDLYQAHVLLGGRAYGFHDERRLSLYLLNNILGGPGMNSRLNVSLREKNGLVYHIESGLTSYSDCGLFGIYFGCDHDTKERCISLVYRELKKMREKRLSGSQLSAAVKQLKGQLGISNDHGENLALALGKSFLHFGRFESLPEIYMKLDNLDSGTLLEVANDLFAEDKLFRLVYI